jgi:hypothetical protein
MQIAARPRPTGCIADSPAGISVAGSVFYSLAFFTICEEIFKAFTGVQRADELSRVRWERKSEVGNKRRLWIMNKALHSTP